MGTGVTPRPTMVDLMRKLRALLDALFICSSLRLSGTSIGIDFCRHLFPRGHAMRDPSLPVPLGETLSVQVETRQ
jgi:hypothetical protein